MMTWLGEKIGFGLATSYLRQWEEAKAENARLQAALTVAEHHWKACEVGWNKVIKQAEGLLRERDGYKALAERRGEELERCQAYIHNVLCSEADEEDCKEEICLAARNVLALGKVD